jgi:hypothetical protein
MAFLSVVLYQRPPFVLNLQNDYYFTFLVSQQVNRFLVCVLNMNCFVTKHITSARPCLQERHNCFELPSRSLLRTTASDTNAANALRPPHLLAEVIAN